MDAVRTFNDHAEEYDRWYDENEQVYHAELEAVRRFIPQGGRGLEVGVGTGRFAAPLGVRTGIDPSRNMLEIARSRGVDVQQARGERLPFASGVFDYALMVTVDPFVADLEEVLLEAKRVLKQGGQLIVATIDRSSPLGRVYEAAKESDKFFRWATLHSADELIGAIRRAGFGTTRMVQTLLGPVEALAGRDRAHSVDEQDPFEVQEGYGEGSFIVISASRGPAVQIPQARRAEGEEIGYV